MLGWVHQAIANEKELLESLFGGSEENRVLAVGASSAEMPDDAEPVEVDALVDKVHSCCCAWSLAMLFISRQSKASCDEWLSSLNVES
jgi:hypothetical protein